MKKFSLIIMLLMAFAMAATAQNKKMKIAVMDFKAGLGMNACDVEGLSDMLSNTLYETKKFDIVERPQLNQVLREQNFQNSELTNEQLARVGRILGVESVLVGTVNFLADHKNVEGSLTGEYDVDVRVVDVESGQIVTTAGAAKSSGSTYRAMMEKIAWRLAENLTGKEPQIEKRGVITKGEGKDIYGNPKYCLNDERLTYDQFMELINNCPESKWYYEKGCKQRKTGNILLITGGGCVVAGALIGFGVTEDWGWLAFGAGFGAIGGVPLAITAIPLITSGKHKKENAYQVYNEYCATKPTASLSFGPANKGIGMGVYLSF